MNEVAKFSASVAERDAVNISVSASAETRLLSSEMIIDACIDVADRDTSVQDPSRSRALGGIYQP